MKKKQVDLKKALARLAPIRRLAELRSSSQPEEFIRVMAEFFFVLREAIGKPGDDFRFVMVSSNAVHEALRSVDSDLERDQAAKILFQIFEDGRLLELARAIHQLEKSRGGNIGEFIGRYAVFVGNHRRLPTGIEMVLELPGGRKLTGKKLDSQLRNIRKWSIKTGLPLSAKG